MSAVPVERPQQGRPKRIADISDPRYAKAVAHPVRTRVLAMLEEQPMSPVALAERLPDVTLGAVAYHVRALAKLGVVELVETRQRRGATEHIYRARPRPRVSAEAWEQLGPVAKQRLVTAMLQQIGEYAQRSAAAGGFDRSDSHCSRTTLKLSPQGWAKLSAATKAWLRQVEKIEEQDKARNVPDEERVDAGLVVMFFEALPFTARAPE